MLLWGAHRASASCYPTEGCKELLYTVSINTPPHDMHRTTRAEQGVDHKPYYYTVQTLPPESLNKLLNSLGLHADSIFLWGFMMCFCICENDFAFKFCSMKHNLNAYLGKRSRVLTCNVRQDLISHKCSINNSMWRCQCQSETLLKVRTLLSSNEITSLQQGKLF